MFSQRNNPYCDLLSETNIEDILNAATRETVNDEKF